MSSNESRPFISSVVAVAELVETMPDEFRGYTIGKQINLLANSDCEGSGKAVEIAGHPDVRTFIKI